MAARQHGASQVNDPARSPRTARGAGQLCSACLLRHDPGVTVRVRRARRIADEPIVRADAPGRDRRPRHREGNASLGRGVRHRPACASSTRCGRRQSAGTAAIRSATNGLRANMRIAVIWAGGIGAIYGASLAKAGADVTFVARGAHLAATRERGLKIEGDRGEMHISPTQATDDPSDIGPVDIVLFCVKLWDVEIAGASFLPLIGTDTGV